MFSARGALALGCVLAWLIAPVAAERALAEEVGGKYFGIHIVDAKTGRGVPLISLRTVNDAVYVTDSAGWAAFNEPDLAGQEVFFHISGPGYEVEKDGFGFRGARLTIAPGKTATVKIRRKNIAQRMYRITGQGIYRDSELLSKELPLRPPQRGLQIVGQDSVQAVRFREQIFWLWGDTNLARYPLGNFKVTAATSGLPDPQIFRPAQGVPLTYLTDADEASAIRKMMPLEEPGAVWLFGLFAIEDDKGKETLIAHYSRQQTLGKVLEHGLARYDPAHTLFRRLKVLDAEETWRHPRGNAFHVSEGGARYVYFVQSFANVRVKAQWASVMDPAHYEALAWDAEVGEYRWQNTLPPTTQSQESKLIAAGKLPAAKARYQLVDAASDKGVTVHRSSIAWNDFRQRYVMIATQEGNSESPSYLGEVWYAEAAHPSGPWSKAVKVASHPRYSFYNQRVHTFFNDSDGRSIYFEGTYTRMFSKSPIATPRYDYNQLMYRLDLGDKRLEALQVKSNLAREIE